MYGILFDFNGTMFFDETFQRQSWKCFLSERLGRAVADDEFQEYVHGRNAAETFRHFFGRDLSREETAALEEEKEKFTARKVVGVCSMSDALKLRLWGADETIADYANPEELFSKIGI